MNEDQYLSEQLEDQFYWYDRESSANQKMFNRLHILETGFASFIPFLSGFIDKHCFIPWIVGLLGVVVAKWPVFLTLTNTKNKFKISVDNVVKYYLF